MNTFRSAAADYLALRRAMGYKLVYHGPLLEQFAAYLDATDAEHLTIAHALSWVKQPSDAAAVWWSARLGVVRGFARYLNALDPATEIPPSWLLPEPRHRIVPYIYSDEDISRLLDAAAGLSPQHRGDTYQTLIGLIAVTGIFSGGQLCGGG
jgi:integrase/recombinase XerD